MKKIFFLFALLSCTMIASAAIGDTIVVNDIYYCVFKEDVKGNQVEVIAHPNAETPYAGELVLPITVENKGITYDVTRIANRAFYNCSNLTSVAMPEGLTEIGFGAFENSGLTGALTLPSTLITIRDYAFSNCVNLTGELVIPGKVTTLAQYAFSGCSGFETLTIPNNIKTCGYYIFQHCTGLTSISISEEWERSLPSWMFYGCTGLTEVVIPDKVTSMGDYAFRACTNLEKVVIGSAVTSMGGTFFECTNLTSVEIKSPVLKTVGSYAFYRCENLVSVKLPDSVTTVGSYAFQECKRLEHITIPKYVKTISYGAFQKCDNLVSVDLPAGLTKLDHYAFAYCPKLAGDLVIPDSVTLIRSYAFRNCESLTSVTFGKHLKTLEATTFYACTNLTSATFNDSLTSIGGSAFYKSGLTSLTLPKELVTIGTSAFRECPITEVVIPEKVTTIGQEAFRTCKNLTSVTIGNGVTTMGHNAFRDCSELTYLTLGNSLASVDNETFYGCTKLKGSVVNGDTILVIPNNVVSIGDRAFYNCDSIRSLTLGTSLEKIGGSAFSSCNQIGGDLIIPESVKTIGSYAFYDCDSLVSVQLGSGVREVGGYAFYASTKLKDPIYNDYIFACMPTKYRPADQPTGKYSYAIPEGITVVAPYAFLGCTELGTVTIPSSVTTIGDYAFRSCTYLVSADIPETVTNIGIGIFYDCSRYGQPLVVGDMLIKMPNTYLETQNKEYDADSIYVVPDSIHRIAGHAFQNCYAVKQIKIHNNITAIEENAFMNCTNLRHPVLSTHLFAHLPITYKGAYAVPDGIGMIVSYAFNNCAGLTAVTIPESVDTIAPKAFQNCTTLNTVNWNAKHCKDFASNNIPFNGNKHSIERVIIGDAVEHVPSYLCYDLDSITSMVIPNSVKSVGRYCVYSCSKLQSIVVGENVDTLGSLVFAVNPNLQSVVWNAKNAKFVDDHYARPFYDSSSKQVTSFTFGETVEHLPHRLCTDMVLLSSITIPKNVQTIGKNAFSGLTTLQSVTWNAKNCSYYIVGTPFPNCPAIESLSFGEEVEYIPAYIANGLKTIASINIPAGVKRIGRNAFYNCQSLKEAVLPVGIKNIETYTFGNCYSLKEMNIPEGVDTIYSAAFVNCIGLSSITFPEQLDTIMPDAFSGCTGMRHVNWNIVDYKDPIKSVAHSPLYVVRNYLTSITFGDKVANIPASLLYEAANLTSITFTKNVKNIGKNAFFNCTGLQKVNFIGEVVDWCNIPFGSASANPVYYAKNLFFNDIEATDVVIPETIDTIYAYSFYNCHSIRSLTIGDNVKAIEAEAFRNDTNMCVLTVGEKVDTLGLNVFLNCKHLEHVTWKPKQIKDVSNSNFFSNANRSIRSFSFGENVEHIPAYLCYDMDSIKTTIVIPNSVKSIGYRTFYSGHYIPSIVLGSGLDTIANEAFKLCDRLKKTTYTGDIASWCGIKFGSTTSNPIYYSKNLYLNDELLTDLVIPESVTSIGQYAFYNCYSLKSAVIGENVASIGTAAFNGCSNIRTITWNPITYTDCESDANAPFANIRTKITSFTFGDKVEHIPAYLCYYMNNVPTYTLPKSVTSVGTSAFYYQNALKRLNYTGTIADWCKIDFANNLANPMYYAKNLYINDEKIVDLIIPENVTSIGQYAFYNMAGLQTVALKHIDSSSLPTVGTDAFTTSTTNSATLHARCVLAEVIASTAPWSSFKNTGLYLAYVTVQTNNPAYGTARATKQPACDGNSTAAIVATPILPAGRFYAWNDGVEDLARTITVEDDVTYTAYFYGAEDYTVHVDADCTISSLTWGDNYTDLSICDIVVADGVTLTCDQDVTVQNMTVNGGGKLVVSDGVQLTITDTFTAQSKDDAQPQMLTEGTGAIKYGDFQFVKNIPADRYYFFSLPFASNTSSVTIDNGAGGTKAAVYNTDWNYLYYDGAAFAQKPSNDSYWMTAAQGTIKANQGYAVGVDAATADTYRSLAFKATSTPDFSLNSDYTVAVTENPLRDDYVHPDKETFKGWNFIYNPYTSNFGGTLSLPGIADADVYVSIPKAGQNKTYTQCRLSDLSESGWNGIPPFYGFFVQVLEDGNVTFDPNGQTISLRAPSASRTTQTAPHYVALTLSDGAQADATTLVIGEHYTDNYEIGSDLQKMLGYGTEPQVYLYNGSTKYAFKSVNETAAAQVQPLGVYLPATGEYTFSLKDAYDDSSIQAIYLYDYETDQCVNLLQTDYTFTSSKATTEKRFALSVTVQKAPSITTAMDATDACVLDAWQEGALCIRVEGVQKGATIRLVNVQGQVVSESTAMDNSTSCSVPQSGLYMVEVTSATGVQVKKIVVM